MQCGGVLVGALALGACVGPFEPGGCADVANFGLAVTVVDARTGTRPTSIPTLIVTEGAYSETARGPDPDPTRPARFFAAEERAGTYTLTVTASGNRAWTRSGVRVSRSGRCQELQIVQVRAELEPEP